jgi:glycosyltransferase involved in cell wall biosynthesis
MKIFQVNIYLEPMGGLETSILELASALEERGHRVGFIYHIRTEKTLSFSSQRPTYRVPVLRGKLWPNIWGLAQLVQIVKRERPDVVILRNVFNIWAVDLLRRMAPTVRFVPGHEMYCIDLNKTIADPPEACSRPHSYQCVKLCRQDLWLPFRVLLYLYRKAEIRVNQKLERLLVSSRYMRQNLLTNGFSADKIEVLPPFVSVDSLESPAVPSHTVLFASRLERNKGTQLLPKIAEHLPLGAKLVVAGEGELRDELLEAAARAELKDRLIVRGWLDREQLIREYAEAQVIIFPSLVEEPFGRVGIEAMAAGRPVVAFDVGGVREWLRHGETGFLVPRGDLNKMAESVNLLLENPDLADKLGKMGRERASALFDRERMLSRLEQVLAEAMRGWKEQRRKLSP